MEVCEVNLLPFLLLLSCSKMNEDPVQTNCSKTLLVHHLPAELSEEEKEDLLKYFGAESVRVFSNRGRLVLSPHRLSHELYHPDVHLSCQAA